MSNGLRMCPLFVLCALSFAVYPIAAQEPAPPEQQLQSVYPEEASLLSLRRPSLPGAGLLGRHTFAHFVLDGCWCLRLPTWAARSLSFR